MNVFIDIDINITKIILININIDIFKNGLIDIDIFEDIYWQRIFHIDILNMATSRPDIDKSLDLEKFSKRNDSDFSLSLARS